MFKSITGQNPPRRAAQSELWAKRLQEMEAGGGALWGILKSPGTNTANYLSLAKTSVLDRPDLLPGLKPF